MLQGGAQSIFPYRYKSHPTLKANLFLALKQIFIALGRFFTGTDTFF
jgi:hypothetical protein